MNVDRSNPMLTHLRILASLAPVALGLIWLTACGAELGEKLVDDDPFHDFDGDGFTEDQGDCDDTLAAISPNATEICDGIDNNCNGLADDNVADAPEFLVDADNDGYGKANTGITACEALELCRPH